MKRVKNGICYVKNVWTYTSIFGEPYERGFAYGSLIYDDIKKVKENNSFVMNARFMRSDADFEPITLMNFNGTLQQVENESVQKKTGKASDLNDMELKRICNIVLVIPLLYSEMIDEIKERTAESNTYAKNLVKIWINKAMIIKDHNNKYKIR